MTTAPALAGDVAVSVKAAVPVALDAANALLSVTVQLSVAPVAEGKVPQSTLLTPVPGVTALASTPAGSFSDIVADSPLAVPPLLPKPKV